MRAWAGLAGAFHDLVLALNQSRVLARFHNELAQTAIIKFLTLAGMPQRMVLAGSEVFPSDAEYLRSRPVAISVTNVCDYRCGGCSQFCGHYPKERHWFLGLEDFIEQVGMAARRNPIVAVFGGEPTLHPRYAEMLDFMLSRGDLRFHVFTNGRRFVMNHPNVEYWHMPKSESGGEFCFLPTAVAAKDVLKLPDPKSYWRLAKRNCVQWRSSLCYPMYLGKQAYLCQSAGAFDELAGERHGWPIRPGTDPLDRTDAEIEEQAGHFCHRCAWCLPEEVLRTLPSQWLRGPCLATRANAGLLDPALTDVLVECPKCGRWRSSAGSGLRDGEACADCRSGSREA